MQKIALWIFLGIIVTLLLGGIIVLQSQTRSSVSVSPTPAAEGESEFVEVPPEDVSSGDEQLSEEPPVANPTTEVSSAPKKTITISIDDTGFTPATVTVAAGTGVTFINNGQGAHWPASDPHPIHTGLPGFDAKRRLATGETYSFTFDKVGTWSFHDHLSPSTKGTIVVTP